MKLPLNILSRLLTSPSLKANGEADCFPVPDKSVGVLRSHNIKLRVEVADTNEKRQRGLMHRNSLDADHGMLFKFPRYDHLSFWMQNTYIPLDIAFLDDDGRVLQISQMSPLSTRSIRSEERCRYALETNRGWFEKNNIQRGSKLNGLCFAQNMAPDMSQEQAIRSVGPEAYLLRSEEEKIKYAEERGLQLEIIYRSKKGHALPPRRLYPLPNTYGADSGKYPILNSRDGEKYFMAFDVSPSIEGDGWSIDSNKPKSFLFSGIVKLDIIGLNGQPIDMIRGMPVQEPAPGPEDLYDFDIHDDASVYQSIRGEIDTFTVDQWDLVRDEVMRLLKDGVSFLEIVDYVRGQIIQLVGREG